MAKKWTGCMQCRYISECGIGQAKVNNIEASSSISSDTGCYNYDEYFKLYNCVQLKLFKPARKRLKA